MNGAGHDFFPRTGFTEQEDGHVGWRGLFGDRELRSHFGVGPDKMIVPIVDFLTEDVDLTVERHGGQSFFDHDGQMVGAERFCHEIKCAKLHGLNGAFDGAECGQDDDERCGVGCAGVFFGASLAVRGASYPFQDFQTGQDRQFQIQEYEIEFSLFNQAQRVLAVLGCDRLMPHPGDSILESEKNIAIVVDD